MKRTLHSQDPSSPAVSLHRFASEFFHFFGAAVQDLSVTGDTAAVGDPAGDLAVGLPDDMAAHFGASSLRLRFHQTEGNAGELVAFGSRTFDQMMTWLERRSAVTSLVLPRRFSGGEELLLAVRPANAAVVNLQMKEETARWIAFNWHITYRSDDKREELFTVIVDDQGELIAQHGEDAGDSAGSGRADDDGPADAKVALSLEALLQAGEALVADASVPLPAIHGDRDAPAETADDPDEAAVKLPPMTQLTRLAEQARKYAIYHADLRCVDHEADILPRLHKVLSRLTGYYNQQIEEVYDTHDPDGSKRRTLELDLERKIAEEVENHRLRIGVSLFSYAVFDVPAARAAITLSDGTSTVDVEVSRNLYTGKLRHPICRGCGEHKPIAALDRNGHLTCDECIVQCASCTEIFCIACGVAACPVCGCENCDACSTECWACGERACSEHLDRCPVCADPVCFACQTECAVCGTRQCRSHLRADAAADSQEPVLICRECAVHCPGCNQYSARLGTCELSGQRFCTNCLVTCETCGKEIGAGFYMVDPLSGRTLCHGCSTTCPTCGSFAATTEWCSTCNTPGCAGCMQRCSACKNLLCRQHVYRNRECGHVLCQEHRPTCAIGGEELCPVCIPPCASCGRDYCGDHTTVCKRCQRWYCQECVRLSGLCDTCATIDRDGEFVPLVDEPCASDERVQLLAPHYRWLRLDNLRYIYYLGRDSQMQAALIVVEPTARGYVIHRAVKLGALDTKHRDRWT